MIKIIVLFVLILSITSYKITVNYKVETSFELDVKDSDNLLNVKKNWEHEDLASDECPHGVPVPMCESNPCNNATCPAVPDANCKPFLCGGCNHLFFDSKNNLINCNHNCPNITTNGSCANGKKPNYDCKERVWCSIRKCSQHTNADCCINYCEDCQLDYYDKEGHKIPADECIENATDDLNEP